MSDCHPPLSTSHSSPTTPHANLSIPCHEPHIRTLAEELEDAEFRTPDGPRGSDPDPGEPNDPDNDNGDDGNNASDPSVEDNPILALINAIIHLSHTTRHRPKDSGAACTKVHEPNTFDGMDLKKLCEFLIQCELNFCNSPQAFCSDAQKVGFALFFLKGIALAWFKPDLLNAIPPAWANDYSEFIIELTTNFSPHNPGINMHYWEHKSEITCQAKTNPQPSSLSKQSLSGGSPSRQSDNSFSTSSSSAGKGKNPQHPSSSMPKFSDSSTPDLSDIISKDGKLTAAEHLSYEKLTLPLLWASWPFG
ncbi:hypothetical protein ID866_11298 [Astraeus odoratus]|nr:hypothetical protein ID866_11298 [Astraeus odoratus]